MDVDAERERITQEIEELERILDPGSSSINAEVSGSSLDSDSDTDSLPDEDSDAADPLISEEERWGEASSGEDDPKEKTLPQDPETCLQLNMVYQEIVQEKLAEVSLLLAQNRQQQEEVMWDLAGTKGPKVKDGKGLPLNLYIGHFLKPYFKDKSTGVGPPANEDAREKAAQGIKTFQELLVTKWKSWEKALLRKSVVSDRLQRLLQPKLLKLEYLQQKQSRATGEAEKRALETQSRDAEKEIRDINQLPEEALLGSRLDSHDWEKISNINFEGGRSAEEIRKFWQNWEHPSINKQEWTAQELGRLQALAAKHGFLHWQDISEELGTHRGAFQCLQQYQRHSKALRRREWTEEEDRMLTQLVQEMRVGSHIPYRRIVYYMEGRDSMQLTYRWTKSLNPSLKKGIWTPEEDAKLLQAVAKYGEQDWFKIREEVPGRSDAQCRDRYLRRLHFSLKKGRWSSKEEEKLVELIEKHGVGHWAKIASELPHRTGSQCLSKWKIMVRKRQGRGRRRRHHRVQWSSSSEDSSSGDSSSEDSSSQDSKDSGDSEPEPEPEGAPDAQEGGQALPPAQHPIPDMDLWVPARQSTCVLRAAGAGSHPGPPAGSPGRPQYPSAAQGGREVEAAGPAQGPSGTHGSSLGGVGNPRGVDPGPVSSEAADESAGRPLTVPQETVLQVLRSNTTSRCRALVRPPLPAAPARSGVPSVRRAADSPGGAQGLCPRTEELKRPCLPGPLRGTGCAVGGVPRPRARQLWQRRRRHTLRRRLLERRLLMAVSPWVGDIVLPRRPTAVPTRADRIGAQLQDAQLASTPVFTLFIQLFQIDTAGCMEVVRERKARLPAEVPSSAQNTPGFPSPGSPPWEAAERRAGHRTKSASRASPLAPCGPRPKPKTVSELLREKRQREARAARAAQGPLVLPPQLLVSPVVLQAAAPPASPGPLSAGPGLTDAAPPGPGAPTAAGVGTAGSWAAAADEGRPALQALAFLPVSAGSAGVLAAPRAPGTGPSQAPVSCPPRSLGQSQAPAVSPKRGLPEAPPRLPAAPGPARLPLQPLSPTPAPGAQRGGPCAVASAPLPVTWVLTAQGLLPVSMPAVVGLPGPAGTPGPEGPSVLLPPAFPETCAGRGPAGTALTPPSTPPPPHIPAGGDSSAAPEPGGLSPPGAAPVAGEVTPQPAAESPRPSQPPPHCSAGPGESPGPPSEPGETRASPDPSTSPPRGPEKGTLDLGLLSPEGEAAVREWLRGQQGGCVSPLGSRLPYQPPTLCSLRALSGLLLHKKALEHRAASLVPGGAAGALQAALARVRGPLRHNPAYLLLRARFLAAFSLPALLATLPPRGVPTTLSAAGPESEDEDLEEPELWAGAGQPRCWARGTPQAGPAASSPVQGAPDPDDADDLDVLRTRHSRHVRKRRRLL